MNEFLLEKKLGPIDPGRTKDGWVHNPRVHGMGSLIPIIILDLLVRWLGIKHIPQMVVYWRFTMVETTKITLNKQKLTRSLLSAWNKTPLSLGLHLCLQANLCQEQNGRTKSFVVKQTRLNCVKSSKGGSLPMCKKTLAMFWMRTASLCWGSSYESEISLHHSRAPQG